MHFQVFKKKSPQCFQEMSEAQEDQFVKIMKHEQRGRMEEQRCSLPSSADTDAFFGTLATSQSRQLDDQRAEFPLTSKTSATPNKKQNDKQRQNALYKRDSFSVSIFVQ
uniref:Uncharacterized protein n=1 Tax=Neogobius melanostomus TaxID=47308 RepID=A0A8C6SZQ0_9GOBI